MRHWLAASLASLGLGLAGAGASEAPSPTAVANTFDRTIAPIIASTCASCHGGAKPKGDLDLTAIRDGHTALAQEPRLWQDVAAALRQEDMPPADAKHPLGDDDRRTMIAWARTLLRARAPAPDPGPFALRRLGAAEYRATIDDLFGADLGAHVDVPAEDLGEGFNQSFSPLLMEKQLLAADAILDAVIAPEQVSREFTAGRLDALIDGKADPGRPDGTARTFTERAELFTDLALPVDGTYTITIKAGAARAGADPAKLAIRLDRDALGELPITATADHPGPTSLRVKLPAGRGRLSLTFLNPFTESAPAPAAAGAAGSAGAAKPVAPARPTTAKTKDAGPRVRSVTIASFSILGPPAGAPGRIQRQVFVAMPGKDLEPRAAARAIITRFAGRAFRRPLLAAEAERLLAVYDLANGQGEGFTAAVTLMLKAVLVSPQFCYRQGEDAGSAPAAAENGMVPLGPWALAARLSYFLWSTMPDDELRACAADGSLRAPAVLEAQTRRLLKDPRSRALVDGFALPWLGIQHLDEHELDAQRFPGMSPALRHAMVEECALQVDGILREGGCLLELIDSDHTWLNQALAAHYGIGGVAGAQMRRVALPDHVRGGAMTSAAVLLATSLTTRTSPVKRGKWVLEALLGQAPPPPPPDVGALAAAAVPGGAKPSLRALTEQHRHDAACARCHRVMDPIGFGLEGFDATGRLRTSDDQGAPVDTAGELPGHRRFSGAAELKGLLTAQREAVVGTVTRKLLAYALGRSLAGYDDVVAEDLTAAVLADGCRLDGLVVRIVTSLPFRYRRAQ